MNSSLLFSIIGGVLPSLAWLWFWLRRDNESPEPTGLIAISFLAGMIVVYFVLPLQKLIVFLLPIIMDMIDIIAVKFSFIPPSEETTKIILWASIEEIAKYTTVFFIAFHSKYFDEPIDAVMYLITAALGFAAAENILYLFTDLTTGTVLQAINTGGLRFIGATIVHTISSAFIGIAIAFSFYKKYSIKFLSVTLGLIVASLLHAQFNLAIIQANGTEDQLLTFFFYWLAACIVLIIISIIKHIKAPVNIPELIKNSEIKIQE